MKIMVLQHGIMRVVLMLAAASDSAGVAGTTESASVADWVGSKAVGANRKPDLPGYVRTLEQRKETYGMASWDDVDWLLTGVEFRTRYEHREDDYRTPTLVSDDQVFTRGRAYLGIQRVTDPFRAGVEFQDSRRFFSDRADVGRVVNKTDLLQLFGELYLDKIPIQQPLSLRFGRMSYDSVDRKLFARNRFRNTSNAFDGFRLRLGNEQSLWEVDTFAFRPVELKVNKLDSADSDQLFVGGSGYWRGLSPHLIVESFWFYLENNDVPMASADREIHTVGLHGFGAIGANTGFDYDVSLAIQFGDELELTHRAWALHAELGHTWDHAWKPRLAGWINYASGDDDPDDGTSERFSPLFGASFSNFGFSGFFRWQNTINPAMRFSLQPLPRLRTEAYYRAIWLASSHDAWLGAMRRDSTGRSGSFVGHEIDARFIYQVCTGLEWEGGYAHFFPGEFARQTGPAPGYDFLYTAATLRF